ncbi:hypothetical protein TNCV_513271 [Trichonephila clavipes]|nr:hypothetical protein TNCV_513271 [Trichonephila clavipes]
MVDNMEIDLAPHGLNALKLTNDIDFGIHFAARIGREPMTVSRIWNQWVLYGNTEHRAGSQQPPITSS